jgi:hypothetical protein
MADKSMNMMLAISAVFQGERAFAAIRKSAGSTANALKKIALETAGIIIGFKAIQGVSDFFGGAIKEAQDARAANEKLGAALARNPKIAAKGADVVATRIQQLTGLADAMEKSGVVAATSLKAGFAGLSAAGFSPAQIEASAEGFRGVVVALNGIGASAGEVSATTQQVRNFIKTGAPLPRTWNAILTAQDKVALSSKVANSELKRGTAIQKIMETQTWRNAAAMETSAGKAWIAAQNWKRVQETIGAPFLDTQLAFTEMWGEVALAIEPVSKEIANALNPAMKDLAGWLRSPEVKSGLADFGGGLKLGFAWIKDNWEPISKGLTAIGVGAATLGVFAVISNPVVLAVAALTGLAAVVITLVDNWKLISPAIDAAGKDIAKSTEWLWKPIADALGKVWPDIQAELTRMVKLVQSFFTGEIDWTALWTGLGKSTSKIGQAVGKIEWGTIALTIGKSIGNAAKSIDWSGVVASIGTGISNAAKTVGGAIAGVDWSGIARAIGHGIGNALKVIAWATFILPMDIYNAFAKVITEVNWADVGKTAIELLGTAAKNALTVGSFLGEISTHIVTGLVTSLAGEEWGKLAETFIKGFSSALAGVLAEVASWGPKIIQSIISGLGGLGGAIVGAMKLDSVPLATKGGVQNKIPHGQYGGIVSQPTLAAIGEAGSEAVIPINRNQRSQGLLAQTARMMGMGGKGGGEQTVSVSMPITVNGAQAGQEASIAREIERHMQDPIKSLLDQLREARDEERRLAYV